MNFLFFSIGKILIIAVIFLALVTFFYNLFILIPKKRKRIRLNFQSGKEIIFSNNIEKILQNVLLLKSSKQDNELVQLLVEAGVPFTAMQFKILKRLFSTVIVFIVILKNFQYPYFYYDYWFWLQVGAGATISLIFNPILYSIKQYRELRLTTEIHYAAKQLRIFLKGNRPLYPALMEITQLKSLTYLNKPITLLLNEWLQDSDQAIENFKQRLGTKDGQDFAVTLKILKDHKKNEVITDILKEREKAYRLSIRHLNDSKAESKSLIYYVITTIPFMVTLITFMYPWIMESTKSLNSL